MKQIIYLVSMAIVLLFTSCTEEVISLENDTDIAVVEAFLKPDEKVSIYLSKMLPFTEEEYTGSLVIDSVEVIINYDGIDYLLAPDSNNPGTYVSSDTTLKAVSNGSYALSFEYNGKAISATTSVPPPPLGVSLSTSRLYVDPTIMGPESTQDPLTITWSNPENSYHLIVAEYMETSYYPISEYLDSENFDMFRKVSTEPILGDAYNLDTRQHLVFFGTYKIIIYTLNEEYVNLYENISQSSLSLSEALSNIQNGLGIFTGVNSKTVLLEVKKM